MNKKDIAGIRQQFKPHNDLMNIQDIFHVYILKESSEIYHYESQAFSLLEQEQQELFLLNFKKVLTGQLDEKLFELKFQRDAENNTQFILHQGLMCSEADDWTAQMLLIVEKMLQVKQYDTDLIVTFVRGQYFKPTKNRTEAAEVSERDEVFKHSFILCSINKTEAPKKTLLFDYVAKQFKYQFVVDSVINLHSPVGGFLFPCFNGGTADVNRILYATGKANQPDDDFIEHVLNSEEATTKQEHKEVFEEILKEVAGDQLNSAVLSNVYEEIHQVIEDHDEEDLPKLDYKDMARVLKSSGVENVHTDQVVKAFQEVIDDEKYELKASSIVPNHKTKSIKINTEVANISISPQHLKHVKQIQYNGKRCLLIEINEDTMIDNIKLIPDSR